ncbi:MAG TPA: hypothetical protein VK421_08000 [Pyrinomonadaceae bacterium]|nr:hypothetical protein [Pyrinomonadaceae bacterium]
MSTGWADRALSTYQDHVVAHVVGATVLGHFVFDEALHLVLDINFVWTIFVDGEMLLRHERLALSELGLGDEERAALEAEFDALHAGEAGAAQLSLTRRAPQGCTIREVELYADGGRRRLIVRGESSGLGVETDVSTGEISVADLAG